MRTGNGLPWSQRWLYPALSLGVVAVYLLPYVLQSWNATLLFSLLVREDGVYESAGALACLLAAAILGYAFVALPPRQDGGRGQRRRNWWLVWWSVFFLVMAGEEMSWGQRMFGWTTPAWLGEVNRQNELTLHNLSVLQPAIGTNRLQEIWILAVVGYFGLLPWLARSLGFVERWVDALRWPLASLPLATAQLVNGVALVVSNRDPGDGGMSQRIQLGEESFEAVAELLFLAFAMMVYQRARGASRTAKRSVWRVVGWVGVPSAALLAWHLLVHELPLARSDALVAEGSQLLSEGDMEGAVARWNEATELTPEHAVGHLMLGLVYRQRNEPTAAINAFERALQAEPKLVQAEMNLGLVLLDQGEFAEAEPHLRRAVELAPNWVEARNNWGVSLVRLGRLSEAEREFKTAMEAAPEDASVLGNLREAQRLMSGK